MSHDGFFPGPCASGHGESGEGMSVRHDLKELRAIEIHNPNCFGLWRVAGKSKHPVHWKYFFP